MPKPKDDFSEKDIPLFQGFGWIGGRLNDLGGAWNSQFQNARLNPSYAGMLQANQPPPPATPFQPMPFPNYPSYAGAAAPLYGGSSPVWGGASVVPASAFMPPLVPGLNVGGGAPLSQPSGEANASVGALANGFNPNEPAPMPNQYNQAALAAQKVTFPKGTGQNPNPNAGSGTGARTAGSPPQTGTWTDEQGNQRSSNPRMDYSYRKLDARLGKGFTDQFIARMGADPISWYAQQYKNRFPGWDLPDARGNEARDSLMNFAAYAAESDAKMLPNAIAEWQQKHGNTPIPQEQWETWSRIALATGGEGARVGMGESQYGVY